MKATDHFAIVIIVIAVIIIAGIMIMPQKIGIPQEESIVVPIRNTAEEKMENKFFYVKGVEYKFIHTEMRIFAGAGAGGQADTIIESFNITQFIEMSPKNRTIYVTFGKGDPRIVFWEGSNRIIHQHRFIKKYWVFGENGEGWIIYEDNYQYQNNGKAFWFKEHDMESVTFKWTDKYQVEYDNKDRRGFYSIIILALGICFALWIRGNKD